MRLWALMNFGKMTENAGDRLRENTNGWSSRGFSHFDCGGIGTVPAGGAKRR
jgi:hypothetical protein